MDSHSVKLMLHKIQHQKHLSEGNGIKEQKNQIHLKLNYSIIESISTIVLDFTITKTTQHQYVTKSSRLFKIDNVTNIKQGGQLIRQQFI